jgi:high-affinity iron transporter
MRAAEIMRWLIRIFAVYCLLAPLSGAAQEAGTAGAQTVVHLLDYIGVDYSEAVQDGKVRNADEFKEMVEFTGQVVSLLKSLPPAQQQAALLAAAETLEHGVKAKAAPAAIAAEAARLRWAVIGAYKVQIAPKVAPDLVAGAKLYQSLCSGCHGTTGKGDGPAGAKLDPAPSNFHDAERMDQRSAYGLYNAISLGVTGTAMVGFKHISDEQRWALAFHVANLRSESARKSGEVLWQAGKARDAFPDLVNVATLSTNELKERFGADAASVHAYLLAQPQALLAGKPGPVALALSKVDAAVAAYGRGDRAAALQLAVTAYVEGYELIERSLANVDEKLMREGEREMMALRNLIRAGAPLADVEGQAHRVAAVLDRARERLDAGALSPEAIFTSALVILLREGLEALLVVAAILAFLIKANRRDALWWVHAGWIGAILLGLVTWLAASYVIDISGTNREITEGVTGLVAAVMLIYVGYWLHNRSTARAWQDFIQESVDTALASRTLWTMAGVSFLAVYREMFETVLFYQALWVQAGESGRGALGGGIAAAVAALATIGWGIFRYSLRLPLGPFFTAMSWLMCALAVVLAGKGIAALQEAGVVGATVLDVPSVPLLGIFPTLQTLAAQAAVLAIIALGFYLAGRDRRAESMEKRTA